MTRLETGPLTALAATGHGLYLPARIDNTDVEALQKFLAQQAMGEIASAAQRVTEQWYELGPWLLGPVLALAALAFRRGVLLATLLLPVLLTPRAATARDWWFTPDQAGQQAFAQENYAGAAQRFQDPAWRAAALYRQADYAAAAQALEGRDDPEALYNRGNALARQGRLEEALAAYNATLKQDAAHADAQYNKSLVEALLQPPEKSEKKPSKDPSDQSKPDDNGGDKDQKDAQAQSPSAQSQQQDPGMTQPDDEKSAEKKPAGESPAEGEGSEADPAAAAKAGDGAAARQQAAAQAAREETTKDEEKMSAEQWLRQVPDDPGGLWRRKFQYQYQRLYGGKTGSSEPW